MDIFRRRRLIIAFLSLIAFIFLILVNSPEYSLSEQSDSANTVEGGSSQAVTALDLLPVKGRAPKTNYSREQFGSSWATIDGCDVRNIILHRDLKNVAVNNQCEVMSGTLDDPYTGKMIQFLRGSETSALIQIDHVVALSDAWQKGAQKLTYSQRIQLANDPLELLAVDGQANQNKADGDAATWLPPNKAFRCQYVARQIAVKQKYNLWVTLAEREAIRSILGNCSGQLLPSP